MTNFLTSSLSSSFSSSGIFSFFEHCGQIFTISLRVHVLALLIITIIISIVSIHLVRPKECNKRGTLRATLRPKLHLATEKLQQMCETSRLFWFDRLLNSFVRLFLVRPLLSSTSSPSSFPSSSLSSSRRESSRLSLGWTLSSSSLLQVACFVDLCTLRN